jgi:hypothetical protein
MEGIREAKHESQAGLTGKPKYYIYPFSPASWQFKPRDLFVCLRLMLICLVLENLLTRVEGLDILTKTFSKEDMDALISKMPYAKAPRPDGVNGLFLKKQGPL